MDSIDIVVRPASVEDLDVVVSLARDAADELRDQRGGVRLLSELEPRLDHPATCRSAIDDPDTAVLCGLWEGFVVAYCAVRVSGEHGASIATITELFTGIATRELGIGDALVAAAMQWARDRGCVAIESRTLPGARDAKNLFERSGLVARSITVSRRLDD